MTAPTPQPDAERVQGEVTAAVRRAAGFLYPGSSGAHADWQLEAARAAIAHAVYGPKDDEGMDDMTMAIHIALCEDSPNECIEWRGACVKAAEAARKALLGGAA